jgi:hypothetical protein
MTPSDGACPYCGASAAATVAVAATFDPAAERAAALAAVRAHPSFDALARDVPPVPGVLRIAYVLPIFVGLVFTAVPAIIAIVVGTVAGGLTGRSGIGIGVTIAIVAFASLFMLIGVGVIVAGVRTRRSLMGGPVRAVPAVVLAKRAEPGKSATGYYVTIGFEDGDRHEFGTLDAVFRSAFEGDAGVAHCRGELLLGFRKVGAAAATEVS